MRLLILDPRRGGAWTRAILLRFCATAQAALLLSGATAFAAASAFAQAPSAAPVIDILWPANGARLLYNRLAAANFACRDGSSGYATPTCIGSVRSGALLDTARLGTHTFTVIARDAQGRRARKTTTYAVVRRTQPQPSPRSAPPPPPPAAAAATRRRSAPRRAPRKRARRGPRPVAAAAAPGVPQPKPKPKPKPKPQPAPQPQPVPQQQPAPQPQPQPAPKAQLAAYDPRSHPKRTIAIMISAFTLMTLLTRGGLARGDRRRSPPARNAGSSDSGGDGSGGDGYEYEGVETEFIGAGLGAVAVGDLSRTWGWPGTSRVDRLATAIPPRLAAHFPLLARVLADGTYLRAILGSSSIFALIAGLSLGLAALSSTGGDATPPALGLTIAVAVLGVLDAAAGLAAVLAFVTGVVALGGVRSDDDVRLMFALASMWFVVPLLAGAARPLRRQPGRSREEAWDRITDVVIAALVGAWAVQGIVLALPGLAGRQLSIAEHANSIALCVLAALVARLVLETVAAYFYPRRLDATEPGDLPEPGSLQRQAASFVRAAIFAFFAYVAVGTGWQLWAGVAMFLMPQLLAVHEDRLPNSRRLHRRLPKGLVALVLMLLVASAVEALLLSSMDESGGTFLANSFVVLAIPGFVLALLDVVGRDGDEPSIGWGKRIAGIGVLVLGIALARGLVV
jgi:hypothetical protein